jgi:cell division septation protein DedD
MSDSHEASWYEIALTHSQIVKIFVVLLLCLVGAFFSGVWIGRDAAAAIDDVSDQATVAQVDDAAGEGREVAQLKFFSDGEVVATGQGARAAEAPRPVLDPGAGSTLIEDLTAAAANQAAGSQTIENQTAGSPTAGRRAEAAPERVADATPVRGTPDAPVAVTREPAAGSAAVDGDLVVQVFSSNDATQARRVLGRLEEGGHPAFLSPVEVGGRTMYRVRIGPYVERSAAERVATAVRRDFKLDTWITSKST